MEAQIHDIAAGARSVLLNPVILTVPMLFALAIVTGVAGRVAVLFEDLRYKRIHRQTH